MRHAVPPMHAAVAARKARLPHAYDGHQKPRLQMRCLLGVHRQTIRRWRAVDATGGLEALLAIDRPTGNPVSLAPAVLVGREQALTGYTCLVEAIHALCL
jgi:hypothetical protein